MAQFVLASTSPRRVDLLRLAGYDFTTQKSGFSEVVHRHPKSTVEANASGKAMAVAGGLPNYVVLAADTIVYLPEPEGVTLGQAKSQDDVRRMLGLLEGRAHEVYSGVAVAYGDNVSVRAAMTRVRLGELTETEISAYVKLGEGVGKAGGYAIQGRAALFVEGIEGEYTNVVGLPLTLTSSMLKDYGIRWY